MEDKKQEAGPVKILQEDLLWDGFIALKRVKAGIPTVKGNFLEITREVHDHGNAVAVLPVDKKRQKALMVSQWRIPAYLNGHHKRIWEAPAGLIDKTETSIDCAKREVIEETGYAISNLRLICRPFASPGLVTERVDIYLADFDQTKKVNNEIGIKEEGEDLELREFSFSELFDMLEKGQLHDAMTIIAIYALKEELSSNK